MKYKNLIVTIGVVVIVLIFGFILMQGKPKTYIQTQVLPTGLITPTPEITVATDEESDIETTAEVSYSNDGFQPDSLTVKVGTVVTWTNNGEKKMWVATASHPTHDELPEFDQLTGAENGSSYSFKFTQAGSWAYHNHLAPTDRGEVIVVEE